MKVSQSLSRQVVGVCAFAVFSCLSAAAQVTPRITQPVDAGSLVTLSGHTHPLARPDYDRGAAPESLPMQRILLVLQRAPEQETALRQLLDDQQNKSSPNYHAWLTPEQFGQRFGPADADVQAVTGWLTSQGFQVDRVAAGQTVIEFSGTAALVHRALHTEIHKFVVNGEEHWANVSDPQIPAALAPVVAGIASLNNFPRKPLYRRAGTFARSKATGEVRPLFTFTPPGQSTMYALGPTDFAIIYNVPSNVDGTGQTIAVVAQSNIHLSDVTDFRQIFGLPPNNPNIILNGPDPGVVSPDEGEAVLDAEWSGAVAKNATIDLVVSESTLSSAGVDLSAAYIVDNNIAPIASDSYGDCESDLGAGGSSFYNSLWQQAAAQGITVLVAAGDNGSAACDGAAGERAASFGLAVNGIASTPFNVALGGTDFDDASNPTTYWNATNSPTTQASAKSYIPETTWNNSCAASGSLTGCVPPLASDGSDLAAGGGGPSGEYAKPAWQTGTGVPSDGARDVPDVSLFAGNGNNGSFYVVCQADANTGGNTSSCDLNSPYLDFQGVGGTSVSAQAFASIMALVDQRTGGRQGNANYVLYELGALNGASCASTPAAVGNSSCIFYDTITGNNSVACTGGSPNCSNTNPAFNQFGILVNPANTSVPAWTTSAGYDLATGLGSVNVANLVNNFSRFQQVSGLLTQIAVGAAGAVWGLNATGEIFWFNPETQSWAQLQGLLAQIAAGANGDVWGINAAQQIFRFNPETQSWELIPGLLARLSVGADGTVWGINAAQQIFRFNPQTQSWDLMPGLLAEIAVGFDTVVWGINSASQIFRFNPGTQNWDLIPGLLAQIAVGPDGDVWGLNSASEIFHFNPQTQSWDHVPGFLARIAVGFGGNVWGINAQHQIYQFNLQSQNWNLIPGALAEIAVGIDGSVWGIDASQHIYTFKGPTSPAGQFEKQPGLLSEIAVGPDGDVWGTNSAKQAFHFNRGTQNWNAIPGLLTQIAVGFGGNVWGINAQNQIFRFNTQTQQWDQIPGLLAQIAVGANGDVWGINASQQIFRFNPQAQNWNLIPGLLAQLSVGADGTVWGRNASQQVFRFNPQTQNWDLIPGLLTQIAVGFDTVVWGINSASQIFRYNPGTQNWDLIPGLLAQIAVGADGSVWGLNSAKEIYRFNPQTQNWTQITGLLKSIAVGADQAAWGINSAQQVYRFR
jgi:Tectonin domain/Pro-kumamolisin, activation domain